MIAVIKRLVQDLLLLLYEVIIQKLYYSIKKSGSIVTKLPIQPGHFRD